MMKKTLLALAVFAAVSCATPKRAMQTAPEPPVAVVPVAAEDSLITAILKNYPDYFDSLLHKPNAWNIQIIYTRIVRDRNGDPVFTDHTFGTASAPYFYPASTVKMPVAALALQRLRELKVAGLDRNSTFITNADGAGQTAVYNDPSTPDGRPTIAQYIRKIFLVSDNDAYNRLYEFLGQDYINNSLHNMGYDSAQVIHHLNLFMSEEGNRRSNPVEFYDSAAHLLYHVPAMRSNLAYQQRHDLSGQGYYSSGKTDTQAFRPFA